MTAILFWLILAAFLVFVLMYVLASWGADELTAEMRDRAQSDE